MEELVKYKGLRLIRKYEQYYIRFIGGQYEEYPCDLRITNKEAMSIISNNEEIKAVRDSYKHKVKWTKEYFINSAYKDYLFFECNMNDTEIAEILTKFSQHEDIKMEFYETFMCGSYPMKSAITVCDYTAKKLSGIIQGDFSKIYLFLIYLRENPVKALADLKQ